MLLSCLQYYLWKDKNNGNSWKCPQITCNVQTVFWILHPKHTLILCLYHNFIINDKILTNIVYFMSRYFYIFPLSIKCAENHIITRVQCIRWILGFSLSWMTKGMQNIVLHPRKQSLHFWATLSASVSAVILLSFSLQVVSCKETQIKLSKLQSREK